MLELDFPQILEWEVEIKLRKQSDSKPNLALVNTNRKVYGFLTQAET